MKEIKFNAQPLKGAAKDPNGDCRCVLVHNERIDTASIAKDMAQTLKISEMDAQWHILNTVKYIVEALGEGKRLDFGAFSLGLSISGLVRGTNGAFQEKKNRIVAHLKAGKQLDAALSSLHPVNKSSSPKPHVKRIVGTGRKIEGEISLYEKVVVTGLNLVVDTLAPDEGVWLETRTGKRLLRGEVLSSHTVMLECRFDGDIEPGEYYFSIRTRCGESALAAPSADRRTVRVTRQD